MIAMIDTTIPESSIQEYIRLGKYSGEKHRPILLKLSRTCEVSSLLSQRKKLKGSGLSVKADLSQRYLSYRKIVTGQNPPDQICPMGQNSADGNCPRTKIGEQILS